MKKVKRRSNERKVEVPLYSRQNSTLSTRDDNYVRQQNGDYLTPIFSVSPKPSSTDTDAQNIFFPVEFPASNFERNPRYEKSTLFIRSVSADLRNQIIDHARTSRREIPRNMFDIGEQIGKGNFGKVFKSTITGLYHPSSRTVAAIKGIKSGQINEIEICFVADPNERGTFSDVVEILKEQLSQEEISFHDEMIENYKKNCVKHI